MSGARHLAWTRGHVLFWAALAIVLAVGIWLRLDHIAETARFDSDQGEYYYHVMRWVKLGEWPMLGQARSQTYDRTIGPGFFYLLLPALLLSNFSIAAGALMVGLFQVVAALLACDWIRRTTHARWLGLLAAALLLLAPEGVRTARTLWNPHFLPCASIALAWLLALPARRIGGAFCGGLMLCLFLPHLHTTAWVVVAVAFIFLLFKLRRESRWLSAMPRRRKWLWMAATLIVFVLLYAPPVLYDLKSPESVMAQYFRNTLTTVPPSDYPLTESMVYWTRMFSHLALARFVEWPVHEHDPWRNLLAFAALMLICIGLGLRLRSSRLDLSAFFLTSLVAAFLALAFKSAEYFQAYYFWAVIPLPVLLVVWSCGKVLIRVRWMRSRRGAGRLTQVLHLAALGLPTLLLLLCVGSLPAAFAVARGDGTSNKESAAIAEAILDRSEGKPYSLVLLQPLHHRAYLHVLLWKKGSAPVNDADVAQEATALAVGDMGEMAFVVMRGETAHDQILLDPPLSDLPAPFAAGNAVIWAIPRQALPGDAAELQFKINRTTQQVLVWITGS